MTQQNQISCLRCCHQHLIPGGRLVFDTFFPSLEVIGIEENTRVCGWGAEVTSIVADEGFWSLDAAIVRITTPHVPMPAADVLEDATVPSVDQIVETVRRAQG